MKRAKSKTVFCHLIMSFSFRLFLEIQYFCYNTFCFTQPVKPKATDTLMTTRNSILKHLFNFNDEHLISCRRFYFPMITFIIIVLPIWRDFFVYNLPYRTFTRSGKVRLAIAYTILSKTLWKKTHQISKIKETTILNYLSPFITNHFFTNKSKYST